jgi:hypothetical protein
VLNQVPQRECLTQANLWCVGEVIEAATGFGWTMAMALLTQTTSKTKTATTAVKTAE